jgi:hypothetical protein
MHANAAAPVEELSEVNMLVLGPRERRKRMELVGYLAALRMAAQACDMPDSAALLPGMVAQPPFSTYATCC